MLLLYKMISPVYVHIKKLFDYHNNHHFDGVYDYFHLSVIALV